MRWFELAWMLRYPVFFVVLLVVFPLMAYGPPKGVPNLRALLGGLLDVRPMQSIAVMVAACVATWSAVLCGWTIWVHGLERIGQHSGDQPHVDAATFWIAFAVSCVVPVWMMAMVLRFTWKETVERARFRRRYGAALGGGVAIAGALVLLCAWLLSSGAVSHGLGVLRDGVEAGPGRMLARTALAWWSAAAPHLPRGLVWLAESGLGSAVWTLGYVDGEGRIYPEHLWCAAALVVSLGFYLVVGVGHRLRWRLFKNVPSLCYALMLVIWSCWILCAFTFYFDTLRVPAEAVLLVYLFVVSKVMPVDHTYHLEPLPQPPVVLPFVDEVLGAGRPGPKRVIVAAATGGGIQSAAWTATVLTELSAAWDGRHPERAGGFARSLRAISSVSGGSVGAAIVAAAYDRNGVLTAEAGAAAREAARASSLEAIAAALVYGDFLNALTPFRWKWLSPGRGSALEEALQEKSVGLGALLTAWAEGVRAGLRPANLFNGTLCEPGGRLVMGTTAMAMDPMACSQLSRMYVGRDVAVATAARLSATFPYVTPAARPDTEETAEFHVVDGGYYDNYGMATLADWMLAGLKAGWQSGLEEVLLLELRGFPPERVAKGEAKKGWFYQLVAPVTTMFKVRSCGQMAHVELERLLLESECTARGIRLVPVVLEFPAADEGVGPPLSWHMTERQQRAIDDAWTALAASEDVRKVMEFL